MASQELEHNVLTRNDILALDIATKTGYFSLHEAGTWNFKESKKRNNNKMHGSFRTILISFIRNYNIKLIVAEDACVNRHFYDLRRLSEFRGILLEVCDECDLPEPFFVNPISLKKFATGSGKATKSQMIAACKKSYGVVPIDDNAADACHLFYFYVTQNGL